MKGAALPKARNGREIIHAQNFNNYFIAETASPFRVEPFQRAVEMAGKAAIQSGRFLSATFTVGTEQLLLCDMAEINLLPSIISRLRSYNVMIT